MDQLFKVLKTPSRFEASPNNIWTNEKISPFIFQSHFNDSVYGGSKNKNFVKNSVDFIHDVGKSHKCSKILDLGCGPGIYSIPLSKLGYDVTGIDISEKAIQHANNLAHEQNLDTKHFKEDILKLRIEEKYDMSLLLYEIYSTFSKKQREILLKKIWDGLTESGLFILDVPTNIRYQKQNSLKVWDFYEKDELFIQYPHYLFFSIEKFSNELLLHHSVFCFENEEIVNCYDWIQCFNELSIHEELQAYGFNILGTFSNLCGDKLEKESLSMAIICQKSNSD